MEAGPVKSWLGHRRSVTTINIHHQVGGGGCSVVVGEKSIVDEDSSAADAEVTNFTNDAVNLRHKKKEDEMVERPMSWEGELSDSQLATIKPEPDETCMESNSVESIDHVNTHIHGSVHAREHTQGTNDVSSISHNTHTHLHTHTHSHSDDEKHSHHNKYPPIDPAIEKTAESLRCNNLSSQTELPLLVDKLLSNGVYCRSGSGVQSTASPDSAVYSCYSPGASPVTSRHFLSSSSGISSPFTPSLSRNNSDASQYGGSNHSSCYSHSYSSVSVSPTQFSPTHSPIQGRHIQRTNFPSPVLSSRTTTTTSSHSHTHSHSSDYNNHDDTLLGDDKVSGDALAHASPAISRQQLINSPCPICGDKISGFHYGIFSCESCKGFFKRTVQNRKNYVCLRGSSCPVSIATRKKCPACRFDKCLTMGMKLEAIREDRTRGGRSTYQCSYTVPPGLTDHNKDSSQSSHHPNIPTLLQEMMEVEHLWQSKENEGGSSSSSSSSHSYIPTPITLPSNSNNSGDPSANLCNIADHRLYKIVKWCKSLPLFKNISIDDQISLLINAWCELLLFSCCYRSMPSPGEIRVSLGKSITLGEARALGLSQPIERMLNFTDHLRRLRVDNYEYVAMKVILLLTSDTSELREPEKVRASQEKALQALQHYTLAHYPDIPSKFGELLLRIPELQRTCQVGKEMLSAKSKEGEVPSFNLLMELLRGDH